MADARKMVVIAADVPYSRRLLHKSLQQPDLNVRAVATAAEAQALVSAMPVHALLIDLVNPPSAGEQLLLQCRVAGQMVPALLFCSTIDRDLLRRLNNLRPVGLLPKPVNFEWLQQLLPLVLKGDPDLLRRSAELASSRNKPREGAPRDAASASGEISDEPVNTDRLAMMFGQLPLLPHVLTQILTISDSEEGTAHQLAEIIGGDPRLSGQLLKVVNSAYFGFARRISTIPEATVILGSEAIRKLAVGASVSEFFGGKSQLLDRGRLWRHSLCTAVAARSVMEYREMREAEEAFAAGLLHDFGRLVLERHFAAQYGLVIETARAEGEPTEPLDTVEERMLGFGHAWVSGWLAKRWNLPTLLGDAMQWHHQPEAAAEDARTVAAAVHIGDVLCHLAGLSGVEGVAPVGEPSAYASGIFELNQADLDTLVPKVAAQAAELEEQLSMVVAPES